MTPLPIDYVPGEERIQRSLVRWSPESLRTDFPAGRVVRVQLLGSWADGQIAVIRGYGTHPMLRVYWPYYPLHPAPYRAIFDSVLTPDACAPVSEEELIVACLACTSASS